MALERYEVISPPAAELRQLIEQYSSSSHGILPHVTIVAHRIGLVKSEQDEQVILDVKLIGVRRDEDEGYVYGEVGSNPVSTVSIVVSNDSGFPAVFTMAVPSLPRDE